MPLLVINTSEQKRTISSSLFKVLSYLTFSLCGCILYLHLMRRYAASRPGSTRRGFFMLLRRAGTDAFFIRRELTNTSVMAHTVSVGYSDTARSSICAMEGWA